MSGWRLKSGPPWQALKPQAQAAAVERWAEVSDPGTRAARMQGLWPVVGEHVGKLRALQDHLSIQQVGGALAL